VAKILNAQVDMQLGAPRYANGWWVFPEKHAYMAVGWLCQLIVVLPEIDTVAVVTETASPKPPPDPVWSRPTNKVPSGANDIMTGSMTDAYGLTT
jgi:CubicO group peptidase (beta-lactamase class C family)